MVLNKKEFELLFEALEYYLNLATQTDEEGGDGCCGLHGEKREVMKSLISKLKADSK